MAIGSGGVLELSLLQQSSSSFARSATIVIANEDLSIARSTSQENNNGNNNNNDNRGKLTGSKDGLTADERRVVEDLLNQGREE